MQLKGKRIFVIEDNNYNLSILLTILQKAGAETFYDRWGVDSLQRLIDHQPIDVILLDLMFPNGVTGYEVFAAIHSDPTSAVIPIIAVSAADPNEEIPKLQQAGFAGFIRKPVNFFQLPQQILAVLEGEAVWSW